MTDRIRARQRRWRIQAESLGILVLLVGLLGLAATLVAGPSFGLLVITGATLLGLFMPQMPPHLVMRLHRARPLQPGELPWLDARLGDLARRAGLQRTPQCWLMPGHSLNAFATGTPEQGAIAISSGMLRHLDARHLQGVLAHEVTHLANRDVALLAFAGQAAGIVRMLATLTWMLVLLSLPLVLIGAVAIHPLTLLLLACTPTAALLLVQALSRSREYAADLGAAELLGSPRHLAEALSLLERSQRPLFWPFRLANPEDAIPVWLRSHPPAAERIRRLRELGDSGRHAPVPPPWTGRGRRARDWDGVIIPERLPPRRPFLV
ncbi:MAG: zinc metalloprotease HtpX [Planctomycetota bacterium]